MTITRLEMEAVGSRAELAGSIRQFDAPEADLTLRAIVDAVRAGPFANVKDPVGGHIAIDATAKGPLTAPVLTRSCPDRTSGFENQRCSTRGARRL